MNKRLQNVLKSLLLFSFLGITFWTMVLIGDYVKPGAAVSDFQEPSSDTLARVIDTPDTIRDVNIVPLQNKNDSGGGTESSSKLKKTSQSSTWKSKVGNCGDTNLVIEKQFLCDQKSAGIYDISGNVCSGSDCPSEYRVNYNAIVRVTSITIPKAFVSGSRAPYDSESRPVRGIIKTKSGAEKIVTQPSAPSMGGLFNTNAGDEDVNPEIDYYSRLPKEDRSKKEKPSFDPFGLATKLGISSDGANNSGASDGYAVAQGIYERPLYQPFKWFRDFKGSLAVNPKSTNAIAEEWYNMWRIPSDKWKGRNYGSATCANYSDVMCNVPASNRDALETLCISKVPKFDKTLSWILKGKDIIDCLTGAIVGNFAACHKHVLVGVYVSSPLGTNIDCSADSCAIKTIAHANARFFRLPKDNGNLFTTDNIPEDEYDIALKPKYLTVPCEVSINGKPPVKMKCFYDMTYLAYRSYAYQALDIPRDPTMPTLKEYQKSLCDLANGIEYKNLDLDALRERSRLRPPEPLGSFSGDPQDDPPPPPTPSLKHTGTCLLSGSGSIYCMQGFCGSFSHAPIKDRYPVDLGVISNGRGNKDLELFAPSYCNEKGANCTVTYEFPGTSYCLNPSGYIGEVITYRDAYNNVEFLIDHVLIAPDLVEKLGGHCDAGENSQECGSSIKRGATTVVHANEFIGKAFTHNGELGCWSGMHFHIEAKWNGKRVDAITLLNQMGCDWTNLQSADQCLTGACH